LLPLGVELLVVRKWLEKREKSQKKCDVVWITPCKSKKIKKLEMKFHNQETTIHRNKPTKARKSAEKKDIRRCDSKIFLYK